MFKYLEENKGENLYDLGFGKDFIKSKTKNTNSIEKEKQILSILK